MTTVLLDRMPKTRNPREDGDGSVQVHMEGVQGGLGTAKIFSIYGKGGIGKTLLTSNLAVFLSWLNKKVVVIDMDLGGANLHTSLGVNTPSKTL